MSPRIVVLATGGTIASATKSNGGVEPGRAVGDMLAEITGFVEDLELVARQVAQMPSSEFGWTDVLALRDQVESSFADGADGVVVAQGTDAIEEVAFALELLVDARLGPVVVTGAMRNPTLPSPDGAANLVSAIRTAADPLSSGRGCLVVLNDEIHLAQRVQKVHTSNVAAFASLGLGPVGTLTEGRVIFHSPVRPVLAALPVTSEPPPVALLKLALGDDGRLIELLSGSGYRGCVVEAMGGGHASQAVATRLQLLARDMPVVLASRTGAGSVLSETYSFVGSERDLLARGLISAGPLDGLKARVLLSLLLAAGSTGPGIFEAFERYRASA